MIRPIDIRLNAAHPDYPLAEAVTFTGSPSTVLIRGVPPNCGRWAITAVSVAATFPDGSTTTRAAVQSANGVWVATLPATATSGRTANGLRILADGIDENGEAVTGYILGVADFAVASLGITPAPAPGETSWQMLYFDAVPSTLRKGDVAKIDGVLKFYNGSAWEPFAAPVTLDNTVTPTSANGVASSGIWSAIWGALSALPTGFTSLYDWCVAQFTGKFAQYYPDGSVKSTTEFTQGIKYNAPDTVNRTITVKPFCNTGTAENDNSNLEGRVVIPPFVDAQGNGYISDDGTRYKVVGVSGINGSGSANTNLTAIIIPNTVTTIETRAFYGCTSLTSVSLPAATVIGNRAFAACTSLTSVSLPAATVIVAYAFQNCSALTSVDFGDTPRSEVPTLGGSAFYNVQPACKIIVPYTQYTDWIAADGWRNLPQEFVRHAEKADKPATFTTGNLAKFDSNGNPADAGKSIDELEPILIAAQISGNRVLSVFAPVKDRPAVVELTTTDFAKNKLDSTSAAPAFSTSSTYAVGDHVTYNGALYRCTTAVTTAGAWDASKWTADMASNYFQYSLVTKTISNGAVSLDDRAINAVAVSSSLASLTVNFPTATSGKARDFGLRLTVASGITTAPELALPQGVVCENADGEAPEIGADGAATILYFTETASGVFLVKGEVVTAIS